MKTLDTQFKNDGFNFTQIDRTGNVALFSKSKPPVNGKSYEVVLVQKHKAFKIRGLDNAAREAMPGSEQWGEFGWTFLDLTAAKRKFNELVSLAQNSGGSS